MRTTIKTILIAPALMFAVACGKDTSADSALNNDLSLAAQANSAARLDSISAAERTNGAAPAAANNLRSDVAPAPAPVRRSTASAPARRSTSSGTARSSGTSSGTTVASEPRTVTKKNTKRDAAIGAAAGAVIGATTSRDKVKGGIIGGVAGGILGGVIGNNVDVQKKPAP